jgi:hypothetical protein
MCWQARIDRERGVLAAQTSGSMELPFQRMENAMKLACKGDGMKSKRWIGVLVVILALGLVVPSIVQAQVRDTRLSDSEAPGSVIVFPKFIRGGPATQPNTEIEISVVCPRGAACTTGQLVRLKLEWVCPGNANRICREVNFTATTTVNGTLVLNPNGPFARATCPRGFLIAWVIDGSGNAIKFDGLIGDAVIRNDANSAGAYNGIPIQADPALANLGIINTPLSFTGLAGQYQAITGGVFSSLRYDTLTAGVNCGAQGQAANVCTFLTMLTLDILSNRVNDSTFVDFVFFDQFERGISTSTDFICWDEQQLTTDIDSNLDVAGLGRKGLMVGKATDQNFLDRSLIMLVETLEHGAGPGPGVDREYAYSTYNDSIPVPTRFRP